MKLIRLIEIAAMGLLMVSCGTRSLTTSVLIPADINVPQHVQTVGILNRSLPAKGEGFNNFLEGFLSGESIMADREGSYNTVKGMANKVNVSPRFKALLMDGEDLRGTGTKEFPVPLTWTEIENLCNKYKCDAVVTLETFDSDIAIRQGNRQKEKTENGQKVKYTEFFADLNIRVNAGWRIYDNQEKKIIDQQVFWDEKGWSGVGLKPDEALRKLPSKRRAINDAGYYAGEMYAVRISPNWIPVSRYYYVKGHDSFKMAKNKVLINDWTGAAEIWQPLSSDGNPKVAARACHNMALAAEMDGKLDIALDWAKKAYSYNLKRERDYINQLSRRISDQDRLKEQLEGE